MKRERLFESIRLPNRTAVADQRLALIFRTFTARDCGSIGQTQIITQDSQGPLEEAFAVRATITAIGTKRARLIGRCRSFLERGKGRAGANSLEGSSSNNPIRHDEFRGR
jgi:hypothetical protein